MLVTGAKSNLISTWVEINNIPSPAFIDTGSEISLVSKSFLDVFSLTFFPPDPSEILLFQNFSQPNIMGTIELNLVLLDNYTCRASAAVFHVFEPAFFSYDIILGLNILKGLNILIDCALGKVIMKPVVINSNSQLPATEIVEIDSDSENDIEVLN